jgi:DNA polymerase I-like protein with 3'-5' exonuclease and polymerase domains
MMPKKLALQAKIQFGITLSQDQAQDVYNAYWNMFALVKKASDQKGKEFQKTGGVIDNPFGFRAYPKAKHAALNQFIQSQVSNIMVIIAEETKARAKYANYITCVHDALILDIPEDKVEHFRGVNRDVVVELNRQLGWTVTVDTGFAYGKRWSDLK